MHFYVYTKIYYASAYQHILMILVSLSSVNKDMIIMFIFTEFYTCIL